jgi:hypothetical protein
VLEIFNKLEAFLKVPDKKVPFKKASSLLNISSTKHQTYIRPHSFRFPRERSKSQSRENLSFSSPSSSYSSFLHLVEESSPFSSISNWEGIVEQKKRLRKSKTLTKENLQKLESFELKPVACLSVGHSEVKVFQLEKKDLPLVYWKAFIAEHKRIVIDQSLNDTVIIQTSTLI